MQASKQHKIATLGGATRDILVMVSEDDLERMSMRNAGLAFLLLEQGRKIEAEAINLSVGGGAINTGVALSRLGNKVATCAKVGKDAAASDLRKALTRDGVDDSLLVSDDEAPTATSVMIFSHDRNPTIIVNRGANGLLTEQEIDWNNLEGFDHLHISTLSNKSADLSPLGAKEAKKRGLTVSTNPGIRQLTTRGSEFIDMLEHVDLVSINAVEAAAILPELFARSRVLKSETPLPDNAPKLMRYGLSYGGVSLDLRSFCLSLVGCGVDTVIVTDGMDGAYAAHKDKIFFCPTLRVKVAGTPGAGDAFTGTFIDSWLRKIDTAQALARSSINSASVVSFPDTQQGLLQEDELALRLTKAASDIKTISCDL